MLLDFVLEVNDDLTKFDDDASWPIMIDEFVTAQKEKPRETDVEMAS